MPHATWWALSSDALFTVLAGTRDGLQSADAHARLERYGDNTVSDSQQMSRGRVLWNQVRSPLLLLLVFAAGASLVAGEWTDAGIVLSIVSVTIAVGYLREYRAQKAISALRSRIGTRSTVLRDGHASQIPVEAVVPGDIVLLAAGSIIPADGVVLEANDCHVSEAMLTGESFPVQKLPGVARADTPLGQRSGAVFMGTNVRSGTARALVVATGTSTVFGAIADRLKLRAPDTEFERGVLRFGYLVTSIMAVMVMVVFTAHVIAGRAPLDTLLFSIALAVGLSPELLPAIVSINLSRSAELMASKGVLVRRLAAIENLGSIDVLCTDKTGTLTEGVVRFEGAYDPSGAPSAETLHLAAANAALQTGLPSALDDAILEACKPTLDQRAKLGEVPFDFVHKRVSVAIAQHDEAQLITMGAFQTVIEVCDRTKDGQPLTDAAKQAVHARYVRWSETGARVLAVATKTIAADTPPLRAHETNMAFAGFVTFLDRLKDGVVEAIASLNALGVSVKMITGDNVLVARHVASLVGLPTTTVLTGAQLTALNDEALWIAAEHATVFAEVDPNQKERIILALKKTGHVVGFLGDGVNDAPAMHAADTSLSVDQAVDVAREAADFVLLERHLDVIRGGIEDGRTTFANTMKYVTTTMSANLGNMLSMAVASLFLPFLPLTAGQILLNNFLSDVPAAGIAGDSVDPELIERPQRWNMRFIARFMFEFGLLSSLFDLGTFALLLVVFTGTESLFRTGWFVESLLTELAVALVLRSRRPFFKSRPGRLLLSSTIVVTLLTLALPYLPFVHVVGLVPLPPGLLATLVGVTVVYVVATDALKKHFYRRASTLDGKPRQPSRIAALGASR